MALREGLDHQGHLGKLEHLELLEEEEREGSMDKMALQGVGVRKERKVNTKNTTTTAVYCRFPDSIQTII